MLQAVKATGTRLMTFTELAALGASNMVAPDPPQPTDLSTIMYTSGTTGKA